MLMNFKFCIMHKEVVNQIQLVLDRYRTQFCVYEFKNITISVSFDRRYKKAFEF